MKAMSIICYVIGDILMVISCFLTSTAATWWVGGSAVVLLIAGCVFQYNDDKSRDYYHGH